MSPFAHWLLQSPGSLWIFPCPTIFSQVLIFSFCQAHSQQPQCCFQRSGLHANCLSMARLPPTYIMHLVSFTQSLLHRFGSFKFRRGKHCKSNASGSRDVKQWMKKEKNKSSLFFEGTFLWVGWPVGHSEGWVAYDCFHVRQNVISQVYFPCQHLSLSSSCHTAVLLDHTLYFNLASLIIQVVLLQLPTIWCNKKASQVKVTKIIVTKWMPSPSCGLNGSTVIKGMHKLC